MKACLEQSSFRVRIHREPRNRLRISEAIALTPEQLVQLMNGAAVSQRVIAFGGSSRASFDNVHNLPDALSRIDFCDPWTGNLVDVPDLVP